MRFSVEEILADSDSEFEDIETDQPKVKAKAKKQIETWIEEDLDNIVDFTDPSVTSKIRGEKIKTLLSLLFLYYVFYIFFSNFIIYFN